MRLALGLSGLMALGMVASAVALRRNERRVWTAFYAGWFVPGMGHALLGKWRKGLFFFFVLAVTYLFGMWLSGWRAVSFEDNPFYHVGQYGSGATTLLGWLLGDPKAFPRDDVPKSWFDPGLLYVCVAGLLNLVIMLSVFDVKLAKEGAAAVPVGPGVPSVEPAPEGKA